MDLDNKYGLLECQKALLKLLATFDRLCRDNNIVYGADSGTLLGAVRHDGFIPWDDDIDVVMSRQSYNQLMNVDLSIYGLKRVRKVWIESLCFIDESEYPTGPILDIFILDHTPDNSIIKKIKLFRIMCLHGMWHHHMPSKSDSKSIIRKIYVAIFGFIGRFFSDEQIFRRFQHVSQIGNSEDTKYVQCYNYLTKELHVLYPHDILYEVIPHKFESLDIYIPKMYDTYLKNLYGDYMTPVQTK